MSSFMEHERSFLSHFLTRRVWEKCFPYLCTVMWPGPIRSTKTHRDRVLPLSKDVGEALAHYLRCGRPASTSRVIFLYVHAPFRPFSDSNAISRIAARALRRAGVTGYARLGAHVFRHTTASQMVNQGANFKDVADVLGHQSLQTTGIYAKLDLATLSEVALPWMGESQ